MAIKYTPEEAAAKKAVLARAKEIGAAVIISNEESEGPTGVDLEVVVEAPDKMIFAGMDVHAVVSGVEGREDVLNAWKNLLDDMKEGFVPCDIEDCDTCHEG